MGHGTKRIKKNIELLTCPKIFVLLINRRLTRTFADKRIVRVFLRLSAVNYHLQVSISEADF